MDFLKDIFEEQAITFEQLAEKLKEHKDIKLGNLATGQYVDKAKHEAVQTELSSLREQLKTANETIEGFKKLDVDGMKKAVKDWQDKYNADTAALQEKLALQQKESQIDMSLMGLKAKNLKAARALLDLNQIGLKDGKLTGLEEQLDTLVKENPFLFGEQNPPAPAGGSAAAGADDMAKWRAEAGLPPIQNKE